MNGLKKRIAGKAIAVVIGASSLVTVVGVAPASAYVGVGGSGKIGVVDSIQGSMQTCQGSDVGASVFTPSFSRVYAAAKYKSYNQTFYAQAVIESWVNGAWKGTAGAWKSTSLPAHVEAPMYFISRYVPNAVGFKDVAFGQSWNVGRGYYRIRYEFRWYVGSTLIGWQQTYAGVGDFWAYGNQAVVTAGSPAGSAQCQVW